MNLHITFGDSGQGTLREALKKNNSPVKWQIVSFLDLFSIGPILALHNELGLKYRINWLKENILPENNPFELSAQDLEMAYKNVKEQLKTLDKETFIIIWTGENAHDQTGLRYVCYLLKGVVNEIKVINVSKAYQMYFKSFVPFHLGEINPEQVNAFLANPQLFQTITKDLFKKFVQDWTHLSGSRNLLRVWKNQVIFSVSVDYYDELIIYHLRKLHKMQESKDFIKAIRLVGEVLGHLDQVVGDLFLEYRIKCLINRGVFLAQGSFENLRHYSVKLKKI